MSINTLNGEAGQLFDRNIIFNSAGAALGTHPTFATGFAHSP